MTCQLKTLIINLQDLNTNNKNLIDESEILKNINLIEEFNKQNFNTFKYGNLSELKQIELKPSLNENNKNNTSITLASILNDYLKTCWSYLNQQSTTSQESNENLANLSSRLIISCLDTIRLVSRDTATINLFEDSQLLDLIQQIANLSLQEESYLVSIKLNSELIQNINLTALKSMSNLIYNSTFAQNFYVNNNAAESITIFLKQFSFNDIFGGQLLPSKTNNRLNIMIFNLRILFLLTVFNKDLRSKLREKLQVITYLIEIIDLVMKERLNVNEFSTTQIDTIDSSSSELLCNQSSNESSDYCYLMLIDIDFINEILKVLYNLTMDIAKPNLSSPTTSLTTVQNYNNEEEEAHLMHLVSVLRDLMTCRLSEHESLGLSQSQNFDKLNELHSNIINLLTNMPSICYEELMTPCSTHNSAVKQSPAPQFEPRNNYYLNVRLAHNRKRQSRRSRRLRQKQDQNICLDSSSSSSSKKSKDHQDFDQYVLISNDEDLEFEGKNIEAIAMILSFMNRHVNNYLNKPHGYIADQVYPVLLLLSLMSKSNNIIRHYCRLKVLPPLNKKDLVNLPQNGVHIRNRLVRLMTDANLQMKRLSAQFLFILCKESIRRLVKYTGYGNAAGLLAEAGLMLSTHGDRGAYSSDSDDSDTEDYRQLEECINPITGRADLGEAQFNQKTKKYVKTDKKDLFEGMTEDQKEYEAMRLVQAIDKLSRLGTGGIKPATIGPDGRPVEIEHVLQLQDESINNTLLKKSITEKKELNENDDEIDN